MKKLLLLLLLPLFLGGCDGHAIYAQSNMPTWAYRIVEGENSNKEYRFAEIESVAEPVQDQEIGRYRLFMTIYKEPKVEEELYSVMFAVDGGDLNLPKEKAFIHIKFDDGQESIYSLAKYSSRFFYLDRDRQQIDRFIQAIEHAEKVVVSFDVALVGRRSFEFRPTGLNLSKIS